nr:hypothetical protein [Actinobacillus seminis]
MAKPAKIALNPQQDIAQFCQPLPLEAIYQPNLQRHEYYQQKREKFATLYQRIKDFH